MKKATLIIAILVPALLWSAAGYNKLVNRGGQKLKMIERISDTYPILQASRNQMSRIKTEWKKHKGEYRRADSKTRSIVVKKLRVTNLKFDLYLRKLCIDLQQYSTDIMLDFSNRIDADRNAKIGKEKYSNGINVSKQEFARAAEAFRQKNYRFSAHLYDRGILILKGTYKKLGWAVPPAYVKVHSGRASSASTKTNKGI